MAKKKINVIRITENDINKMIVETAMQMDEGKHVDAIKKFGRNALGTIGLGAALGGTAVGADYLNTELHKNDKPNPTEVEMKAAQRQIMRDKANAQKNKSTAPWPAAKRDSVEKTNEGMVRMGKKQLCDIINEGARRLVEISNEKKQAYMDGQIAKKEGKRPLSQANLKAASKYMKDLDKKGIPHNNAKTPEETARLMAGDKASKVMQDNRGKLKPTSNESFDRIADRIIAEEIRKALKS